MEETIAALATPPGTGGIAVVLLSGSTAYAVAQKVFRPEDASRSLEHAKGYSAFFGHFWADGSVLDEGIALCFRAPHSYTGEDIVELSCHGGSVVSEQLLRACYRAGARPAQAGEFTRRAFCNGRISLTQAEAVMDLIQATSRQAVGAAQAAMEGVLYQKIHSVQEQLVALMSHLAAYTDYPEEDVPELRPETLCRSLDAARKTLRKLLDGYQTGCILRRGVCTVIAGSPNVGKSTLLNLMSGFERAIVTPVPGTTRDVVEQEISLGGVRLLLADTAGLRETKDLVEAEGIRRSNLQFERAGLILAVFDASRAVQPEDVSFARRCQGRPAIAVLNKTDLPRCFDAQAIAPYFSHMVCGSARDPEFLQQMEYAVTELLGLSHLDPDAALLANERQFHAAQQADEALQQAVQALHDGYTLDAAGVCMEDALHALYALTGEDATEDVIEAVFSRFCVGK